MTLGVIVYTLAYFALSFALGWLIVFAYDVVTPMFQVWEEVHKGNLAVAMAVGGQMIGAGILMYSAIIHNADRPNGMLWTLVWGLIGGALQIFGYLIFDLVTPKLAVGKELAADNRAVGFVSLSIAVALGIVGAACIS